LGSVIWFLIVFFASTVNPFKETRNSCYPLSSNSILSQMCWSYMHPDETDWRLAPGLWYVREVPPKQLPDDLESSGGRYPVAGFAQASHPP
jgi:hypothetical protein